MGVGEAEGAPVIPRQFYGLVTAPNIETAVPKANARLSVLQPDSVLVDLYSRPHYIVVTRELVYEMVFGGEEWMVHVLARI